MKHRVLKIVLVVLLIISIAGNFYMLKATADAQDEVDALNGRLAAAGNQIAELQKQLAGYEEMQEYFADLQARLEQGDLQIEELKNSVMESNTQTEPLENITEDVYIYIPGLEKEYTFLWMSDLHIITENDEIAADNLETVTSRRELFKNAADMYTDDYWLQLSSGLDAWGVDAFLFGGDMIDHAANENIACLKQGLDGLDTAYLYVRADHDSIPFYCMVQDMDAVTALHTEIDGYEEVSLIEFDDLCIVGINDSTEQLSEAGLERFKDIYAKGKPIILVTHVPLNSLCDTSLEEYSKEVWDDRALVWGEDCYYKPNEITQDFLDMVYREDSLVKEVLGGHLHFSWDGQLTENTGQHVFAPAYTGSIGIIRVGD